MVSVLIESVKVFNTGDDKSTETNTNTQLFKSSNPGTKHNQALVIITMAIISVTMDALNPCRLELK